MLSSLSLSLCLSLSLTHTHTHTHTQAISGLKGILEGLAAKKADFVGLSSCTTALTTEPLRGVLDGTYVSF